MNDQQREVYLTLLLADRTEKALAFRDNCDEAEKAEQGKDDENVITGEE